MIVKTEKTGNIIAFSIEEAISVDCIRKKVEAPLQSPPSSP